jgi:PAS domain S-box-containing protein
MSDHSAEKRRGEISSAILESLLESSDNPIFSVDTAYRYTSFNTSHAHVMKALYGADIEVGRSILDYQSVEDDRLAAQANLDRALRGEQVVQEAFSGEEARTRRYFKVTHDPIRSDGNTSGVAVQALDITERKRAEEQLRDSEDKFKYVFDYSPLGTSITLPSGEIHVNEAFCRMVGYSQEELEHTRWQDITVAEDIELTQKQIDPLFSGERDEARFVKRYRHKDGSIVWADVATSLRRDEAGAPVYFFTAVMDITERRAAEESLRASEKRYRELVDHMTSGVVVYEPTPDAKDFLIRDFNAASQRIEQLDRNEVVGRLVTEAFPGVEEFGLLDVLRRVAHKGKPEYYPTALYHDRRLSSWRENYVYRLPSGEVVAVYDDVTERVRAEQTLAHAKNLLDLAEEIGHAGGWEYDVESGHVTWTDEVYRIHGVGHDYASNDVSRDIDFYAPESAPLVAEAFRRAVESGEPYDLEVELDRADGLRIWVRTIGRPVIEDGAVVRVIGNIMDITERKKAEENLAAAAREWRQTFDAMMDSVTLFDQEGRVLRCNAATTTLTGRDFEDIVGRPCYEVFHGTHAYHAHCPQRRALESGQVETSVLEQDGRWLRFTFAPEVDAAGRVVGGVHVVSDVTDLKLTEQRLLESISMQETITDGVIAALARNVEVRDPYTAGHQRRVSALATAIAQHMGLGEESLRGVQVAGMLHDVGKITIPAEILSKPGRLSQMEFELIKVHPQAGFDVLEAIDFPWPVAEITLQHHERLDGSGYPAGLTRESILQEARILAVADVVEAMISHRPYRAALPLDAAMAELEDGAGSRYDVVACEAAIWLFREQGFAFSE